MMDLITGEIGARSGAADPTVTTEFGTLAAGYDGNRNYDVFSSSLTLDSAAPFTIAAEYYVNAFSPDSYALIAGVKCSAADGPLVMFSTTGASYKDVSFGLRSGGRYKAAFPNGINSAGEPLWIVWVYNGGTFSDSSSHTFFVNGKECSLSSASTFTTPANASSVGAYTTITTADLNGYVRQVRVYERTWSEAEARRFYSPDTRDSLFAPPRRKLFAGSSAASTVDTALSADGAATATGAGASLVSVALSAAGAATGTLEGTGEAVVEAALSADAAATATATGASLVSVDLSADGAAAGTLTAVAIGVAAGDLSADGAATVTGEGAALVSVALSADGAATGTLVGEDAGSFSDTAISADGAATGTFSTASLVDTAITGDGAATADATGAALASADLSADGAATGTLEGEGVSGYVTADLSAAGAAEATMATASIVASDMTGAGVATATADTGGEAANAYLTWGSYARRQRERLDLEDDEFGENLAALLPIIMKGHPRWQARRRTGATASSAVLH